MNKNALIRDQMEKTLERFKGVKDFHPPVKGWIRAVRNALGMSARQLASRIGVAQQAVSRIEKDELSGSVTIKTMRRAAEGLDCIFVYGLVPRKSIEQRLQDQARHYAKKQLAQVSHTMSLEAQALSTKENLEMLENLIADIISKPPANLWDTQ